MAIEAEDDAVPSAHRLKDAVSQRQSAIAGRDVWSVISLPVAVDPDAGLGDADTHLTSSTGGGTNSPPGTWSILRRQKGARGGSRESSARIGREGPREPSPLRNRS